MYFGRYGSTHSMINCSEELVLILVSSLSECVWYLGSRIGAVAQEKLGRNPTWGQRIKIQRRKRIRNRKSATHGERAGRAPAVSLASASVPVPARFCGGGCAPMVNSWHATTTMLPVTKNLEFLTEIFRGFCCKTRTSISKPTAASPRLTK